MGNDVGMTDRRTAPLAAVLDRVERAEVLGRLVARVDPIVRRVPEATRRDLGGVSWLGHPLHPALVHLPLGAWMSAAFLDATHRPDAARALTVLGVVAAVPAAAAGWSDWADLREGQKRTGLVHAAANTLGLVLYTGSIMARCAGKCGLGQKLGLAGLAAVGAGGAIGGDLAFHRAAGTHLVARHGEGAGAAHG